MTIDTRIDIVVGTYSRLDGEGLIPLSYHRASDAWIIGDAVGDIVDASHGAYLSRLGCHYFVEEAEDGRVSCHSGPQDHWRRIATRGTAGAAPCHCALDPDGNRLAVANYGSGTVALYRLDPVNGTPVGEPATYGLAGRGPDAERQTQAHAHWVGFAADGRTLYCVDLGSDRIWAFAVGDADTPLPPPSIAYRAPAGSGPRHLAFHPTRPVAFLVSELASTLTMLMIGSDGALEPRVTASTVPEGVSGSLGGAVATNRAGDRVYVTNRGHDSVAVFGIEDDALVLLQHVGTRGKSPRFILLMDDEARLLVANEEGGGVSIFAVRPDGTLSPCPHTLDVNGAVFLAEMPSSIARPSAWPS